MVRLENLEDSRWAIKFCIVIFSNRLFITKCFSCGCSLERMNMMNEAVRRVEWKIITGPRNDGRRNWIQGNWNGFGKMET